ncbi:bifunctional phosphopantothenoylcysteine decarboxylase/phosphopantothenate--cysteine ligase CoaBC [Pseudofrancisella aestuarii]|uniref:Coenzyme A biosynthesis bifunctional protein CoaBC n=1 Tax=Pseudofrancisella aestuarii TaxID=2670347 RepID=A0ABV9T8L1_9GAMM|nr:bifunctional phosphopantothenoylcysteine decarboxylase/phosphopantothenate--cysteine ligase CoaBC [Pseudofrancisella aestuarii]
MANKVLFGITGSVSAFKAITLIRLFIKSNYQCKAIVTKGGLDFIKPELLVALGCETYTDEALNMSNYDEAMSHINLSRWADKIIIVPASANVIARVANGIADDLLSQMLLACKDFSKVYIAPAMNVNMWNNPFTKENMEKLKSVGYNIIEPDSGLQACGDIGGGRLSEAEDLFQMLATKQDLTDKKVLITVGATVENIDGVRYLSNYSSGKMGLALVNELLLRGAKVTVLKAKTEISFDIDNKNLKIIDTKSAEEMNKAMLSETPLNNIFIACAAVADYKIKNKFEHKIKKTDDSLTLEFIKNPDVLLNCKKIFPEVFAVGFAAESQNLEEYALAKLQKKNLDMIVANDISVLGKDDSSVIIIPKSGKNIKLENISKKEIARNIIDAVKENHI